MAITVLDTETNIDAGASYAPSAGSNRAVLWGIGTRDTASADEQTGATYDGDAMTADGLIHHSVTNTTGSGLYRAIEANLPAGSAAFVLAYENGAPTENQGVLLLLAGYDQGLPEDSSTVSASGASSWAFPAVDVTAGGIAVIHIVTGAALNTPSGYTAIDPVTTPPVSYMFYKLISSTGTEAPTVTIVTGTSFACGTLVSYKAATTGISAAILRRRQC